MNKVLKYSLLAAAGLLTAAGITCAVLAGDAARRPLVCTGLEIEVLDSLENSFVSKADIRKYLDKGYGEYVGKKLDSLNINRIEEIIDSRSAVLKSQAYLTRDGILHIDVTQRKPVVRFQKKDGGFYADKDGYIFPLQSNYASHVQIIDGNIPLAANSGYKGSIGNPAEKEWFTKVMNIVNYMENSRIWKDKIVQISVDAKGDLILVPREGKELFLFGQPVDIEEKFEKMEKYYTAIIPEKGKDAYRTVDLKYRNQIVCK